MSCSEECTDAGCWGAGADQCLECKHIQFNGTCLRSCQSRSNLYTMADKVNCGQCHAECKGSCNGPAATDCHECLHVHDDNKQCVPECSSSKYPQNGTCVDCDEACIGCIGPQNTIGENGCIACEKALVTNITIEHCLKKDEKCPGTIEFKPIINHFKLNNLFSFAVGYFYEYLFPQENGVFKRLAGNAICRKCHPRCKKCTAYGFHSEICSECVGYEWRNQCEDVCPIGSYADEVNRKCIECHSECRGCTGPGPDNCVQSN